MVVDVYRPTCSLHIVMPSKALSLKSGDGQNMDLHALLTPRGSAIAFPFSRFIQLLFFLIQT